MQRIFLLLILVPFCRAELFIRGSSPIMFHRVTIIPTDNKTLENFELLNKMYTYSVVSPSPNIGIPHVFIVNSQDLEYVKNIVGVERIGRVITYDVYASAHNFNANPSGYGQFNNPAAFYKNTPSKLFQEQASALKASVLLLGLSYEDRKIYLASFNSQGNNIGTIDILLVGGLHSQSPTIPDFFVYFMETLASGTTYAKLQNNVNWHFIPIINPDGFETANLENPVWVKNLSPGYDGCIGTHLLTNFMDLDAEDRCEPCSLLYPGAEPFSEIETRYLRSLIFSMRFSLKLYINVGFFGSFLTWTNEKITHDDLIKNVLSNSPNYPCIVSSNSTKMFFQNDLDWMREIGVVNSFALAINTSEDFRNATKLILDLATVVKLRHTLSQCVWMFKEEQSNSYCNYF